MKDLKEFIIPFVGLKETKHIFEYEIDNTFFGNFQYDEFEEASLNVQLDFEKKTTMFVLNFKVEGSITVFCDLTGEPFELDIKGELPLIVKFGQEFNDDHEEILIIPHGEYELNISQYIYEMIVLSVPQKRVHPKVIDGTLKSEVLDQIESYKEPKEDIIDPRWAKLKEIQTNNKKEE